MASDQRHLVHIGGECRLPARENCATRLDPRERECPALTSNCSASLDPLEPPLAAVSSEPTFTRRSGDRIVRLHLWFLQNFGFEVCLIIKPGIGLELQEGQEWEQSNNFIDPTRGGEGRGRPPTGASPESPSASERNESA